MSYTRLRSHHWPLGAALLLAAGCVTAAPVAHPVDAHDVHWGYSGAGAPDVWGTLKPEFATCGTGLAQSPIDLSNAVRRDVPDLRTEYRPTPLRVANLGHTAQVNYQPGSAIMLGGTRYDLLQFHFHTPAEHRLEGRELPAELHLVHRGPQGDLAVVGVMIERGAEHQALRPFIDNLPRAAGAEHAVTSARIDASDLLPATREHYRYPGSLTTPPCSEGVTWLVLNGRIQMSDQQIRTLQSAIGVSNRPVQPRGSRELLLGQ